LKRTEKKLMTPELRPMSKLQLISLAPLCQYGGELNGGASRAIAAPIHRLFAGRTNYICHWPAARRTQIA
jgi:hypothetical protein